MDTNMSQSGEDWDSTARVLRLDEEGDYAVILSDMWPILIKTPHHPNKTIQPHNIYKELINLLARKVESLQEELYQNSLK